MNFKFGVLYGKAGQKTDNDMFSNGEHLDVVKIITLTSVIILYMNVICKVVDPLPVVTVTFIIMSISYLEHGSRRFQNFVELLGDEVGLQGWPQFRGGLDNKSKSTGTSLT